jgi:uncharacterized spore protein YtfJ
MSELRVGTPITVAGITLIPIERVRINCEKQSYAYWINATKEAVAVVICEPEGPRIMDVEAHERHIDELIMLVPELKSLLIEFFPP